MCQTAYLFENIHVYSIILIACCLQENAFDGIVSSIVIFYLVVKLEKTYFVEKIE